MLRIVQQAPIPDNEEVYGRALKEAQPRKLHAAGGKPYV